MRACGCSLSARACTGASASHTWAWACAIASAGCLVHFARIGRLTAAAAQRVERPLYYKSTAWALQLAWLSRLSLIPKEGFNSTSSFLSLVVLPSSSTAVQRVVGANLVGTTVPLDRFSDFQLSCVANVALTGTTRYGFLLIPGLGGVGLHPPAFVAIMATRPPFGTDATCHGLLLIVGEFKARL